MMIVNLFFLTGGVISALAPVDKFEDASLLMGILFTSILANVLHYPFTLIFALAMRMPNKIRKQIEGVSAEHLNDCWKETI